MTTTLPKISNENLSLDDKIADLNQSRFALRDEVSEDGREMRTTLELLNTVRVDKDGHREVVALVIKTSKHLGTRDYVSLVARDILVDRPDPGFLVFGAAHADWPYLRRDVGRFSRRHLEGLHADFLHLALSKDMLDELVTWAKEIRPAFIVHLRTDTASRVVMRTTSRDAAEERAALLESRRIQSAVIRVLDLADAS
ncbi:hypothetical protein [Frigoribacterium sp. SL97]|uniref:hypothetical protein n=1 Tax=Frigoribacterium sp. SL97 TaxID=2994664 RepID=UPI00226F69DD|nr:hypothetical protein [Frigoribacterium sp. SL97]WAC50414.1 hypothetical protein OVA02_11085 [Frigoribacterium sp. SL97]